MKNKSKWFLFSSLYITQYLGFGFITVALIAVLRKNGASLTTLGIFNLLIVPYTLKFLWAPLVDKLGRYNKKGHYRSWLLGAQILMTLTLLLAIFTNPTKYLNALLIVLFVYIFACAIQDLALDALACRIFKKEERQNINGIQIAGGMVGNIIGGGLMLILYPYIQWKGAMALLAFLTFLAYLQIYLYKEPKHKLDTKSITKNAFARLITFWSNQRKWLFAIILYAVGFNFVFALLTPTLVDSGWKLPEIGFALKIFGSLVGVVSAMLIPLLIKKIGRYKSVAVSLIFQGFALLFMLPLILGDTSKITVYLFVGFYFFSFPAVMTSISTIMMDKSVNSDMPSTDYTIQNSIFLLISYIFSAISLSASDYIDNIYIVIFGSIMAMFSGIVTFYIFKKVKNDTTTYRS